MNWVVTIYAALLFFVLTPGVLLSLPPKSGKLVVAATHAVVFAIVWHFTHKLVWQFSVGAVRDGMGVMDEMKKVMGEMEKNQKQ
jgi:hypothetical protein